MSWDEMFDEGEPFVADRQESLRAAAREYLGANGDAVDVRVRRCLEEAGALLASGHPGPALSVTTTAVELMI